MNREQAADYIARSAATLVYNYSQGGSATAEEVAESLTRIMNLPGVRENYS